MKRRLALTLLLALALCIPIDGANGIVITYKSSVYSTSAGALTCSPTWTPTANALVVAFVVETYSSSPVDPTGVTGHGLTYSALTLGTSTLSTTHKLSAWAAKTGGSPTSVACTETVSGTTTGGAIIEFEVVGADTSGTALQAFQATNATNTGTSTTPTVTLASPTLTGNRAMTFVVQLSNAAPTTSGTWTLTAGASGSFTNPATGAAVLFKNTVFDTAGAATTANVNWRMVGVELKSVQQPGLLLGGLRNRIIRGWQ
jgi:hypothetical protein